MAICWVSYWYITSPSHWLGNRYGLWSSHIGNPKLKENKEFWKTMAHHG